MTAIIEAQDFVSDEGMAPISFRLPSKGLVTVSGDRHAQVSLLLRQLTGVAPALNVTQLSSETYGQSEPHGAHGNSGTLRIFNKPVAEYQGEGQVWLRTKVAFIQAGAPILSVVTALQNVLMPVLYHGGKTRERALQDARQWLSYLGFYGDEQALPADLTSLQRLQVALARALALSPDVIAIESPWRDVDNQDMSRMLALIERLSGDYLVLCKGPVTPLKQAVVAHLEVTAAGISVQRSMGNSQQIAVSKSAVSKSAVNKSAVNKRAANKEM